MAPPNRRSSRQPSSSEPMPAPEDSTRIKSASAVRRNAPREEEFGAAEDEAYPPNDDTGDQGYDDEGTPTPGGMEDDDENPDATRAGPPLTLEIIEGPDQGRKKRFKSVRMVIGRGQDCDLMLLDQSVSRRHVELVYGGESGVMLRDLVSGNGTRVNDERVDECKLKHDDVIAIGRTRLRFVDEQERIKQMRLATEEAERKEKEEAERKAKEKGEAAKKKAAEAAAADTEDKAGGSEGGPDPEADRKTQVRAIKDIPPRRAPPPRTNVGLLAAAALVLLIALIGGGVLFIKRGPPPPPPSNPKEALARKTMDGARTSFKNGDYAEAVKLAEEAESLFPELPTDGFLETARKELSIVQAFEQVRLLAAESKLEEARELLAKTPHGVVKTEEMREKLDTELASAEVAWLVKQVEMALEARDVEGARTLIRQLPLERQPLYQSQVDELKAQLEQEDADAASQDRAARAAAARRAKEQRAAFIATAFSAVETRFNAGDYSRAALECDRVIDANSDDKEIRDRAKQLKKLLPQFARVYQDAQRKVQANALESAARPLRSAAELYRQIGFNGPVGETLNGQLAASAVVAGKAALARKDLAAANGFFNDALRLRPDDTRAQEGLEAIQGRLNDLYKQAYIMRDREPEEAAERFRLVFQLAAEGSELKTKAEAQLLALEQP
ncbi:FHA domain-containing protein [Archangium lansingense]|uniref:FHA domain-containing protein n=1 Tax=Archangium lansingense TaxID=2995310 RepID=A0ABT4A435_9BACT|nr:FHA domain-containing protein [Archangium lansinium]MCY1076409.1 FHA domain-containing protein [Archangium lansinium]